VLGDAGLTLLDLGQGACADARRSRIVGGRKSSALRDATLLAHLLERAKLLAKLASARLRGLAAFPLGMKRLLGDGAALFLAFLDNFGVSSSGSLALNRPCSSRSRSAFCSAVSQAFPARSARLLFGLQFVVGENAVCHALSTFSRRVSASCCWTPTLAASICDLSLSWAFSCSSSAIRCLPCSIIC
jgi:hypothetical protein